MKTQVNVPKINENLNKFMHTYMNENAIDMTYVFNIKDELGAIDTENYIQNLHTLNFENNIINWCKRKQYFTQLDLLKKLIETIIMYYKKVYVNDKVFNKNLRNVLKEYKEMNKNVF